MWLIQETPYSNLASGLLSFRKEVLTGLPIEIDNGRDRLEHTVATFSTTVLGIRKKKRGCFLEELLAWKLLHTLKSN